MRLPLFFPLFLASCGLVGAGDTLLPFPSDGTSGFGEAELVEVCWGAARVVPFGAPSGAVCVEEGRFGKACSDDTACAGIERCVCGRCIIEACEGGASCGEGRVCRDRRCTLACTSDDACAAGEVCSAGGCTRVCAGDGDCHFGERCDKLDDTCRAKPCSAATPCGQGTRCEAASLAGELSEPFVTDQGDIAYVDLRTPSSHAIYRAIVDDGHRWTMTPEAPILGGDGDFASAPSVLENGNLIELYYTVGDAKGIGHAVSTDGGPTFTKDPSMLLAPSEAWEEGRVGSPSVVRYRDAVYLFFEGGRGAGIGLARVEEGVAKRLSGKPIMTREAISDPVLWHHVTSIGAPSAIVVDDVLRVYFTAKGAEGSDALIGSVPTPAEANDSIGLFATTDLQTFVPSPSGPVFSRLVNLRTYLGERQSSVRATGDGGFEITFVASDASGQNVAGLATARTTVSLP